MKPILEDFRYGMRQLLQHPALTLVAVLTLGSGIAANTTVFRWMDSVILHPLAGVADASNLYALESRTSSGEILGNVSWMDYKDYRDALAPLGELATARFTVLSEGEPGKTRRIWGELVSPNYFDLLGVPLQSGPGFAAEHRTDTPLSAPVAVISDQFWRQRFGADPHAIGRRLRVNLRELTIVGIAPSGFAGTTPGLAYDVWIPLSMAPAMGTGGGTLGYRGTRDLTSTFLRLKPGVLPRQASHTASALAAMLAKSYPKTNEGMGVQLVPVAEAHLGAQRLLRNPLRVLTAVCAVLFLIVCANVANLLLVRFLARRKELEIRLALGAQRRQLVRQLLSETLLLALLGACLGTLLSSWMDGTLAALLPPNDVPLRLGVPWHGASLVYSVCAAIAATLLCGAMPAWMASRPVPRLASDDAARSTSGGVHVGRLRRAIVIAEVALATTALIAMGLFGKSFLHAQQLHPGFRTDAIVAGNFFLTPLGYSGPQQREYCMRLRERLLSQPEMIDAAYTDQLPLQLGNSPFGTIVVEGYGPAPGEDLNVHRSMVSPNYFQLMEIPLLEGRSFTLEDRAKNPARAGQPEPIIVNRSFARRFFAGASPIGRRVQFDNRWVEIVGMVEDSRIHSPTESPAPFFYRPFLMSFNPGLNFSFLVRYRGPAHAAIATLRREALITDRNAAVSNAMPLRDAIGNALYPQKVAASLLSGLGAVALFLAALGLFGVMSYAVAQRTREIAIRVALGARKADVLRAVLPQSAAILLVGIAAGVLLSLPVASFAQGLLAGVDAVDPWVIACAAGVLIISGVLANAVPAWRALRIAPAESLRGEQ